MEKTKIKFAVSVFKNQEAIRAELWDYEPEYKNEFFSRIVGALKENQSITLMISQTLFVEVSPVEGDEFIAKYNVEAAKTEQTITLLGEYPRTEEVGFKLLSESFQKFIKDILVAHSKL